MKAARAVQFACAALLAATPVAAHHSFAMFDQSREVVIEGVVKEFQWTNPHTWTQVLVRGSDGQVVEWSIEGASVNGLARRGWNRNSMKPGDRVVMTINPLKNGDPGGSFVKAVFPDGRVLVPGQRRR